MNELLTKASDTAATLCSDLEAAYLRSCKTLGGQESTAADRALILLLRKLRTTARDIRSDLGDIRP